MQSLSKIHISFEEISKLCEQFLGTSAEASTEITDGWFNTIHKIVLNDGSECVLKISPPPEFTCMRYEKNIIRTEAYVLQMLQKAGIPAPKVLAYAETTPFFAHPCFFMEKVPGITWGSRKAQLLEAIKNESADKELLKNEIIAMDQALGELQANINNLSNTEHAWGPLRLNKDFAKDGIHCCGSVEDSWTGALLSMVQDLLDDAADKKVELPKSCNDILEIYSSKTEELERVKKPSLVLWDLHDGNVLVHEGKISGVLDCDRALWGDPLMEFWFRSMAGASSHFLEAYSKTINEDIFPSGKMLADPAKIRDITLPVRIKLYDLYLALVQVIECSFRGYAEAHKAWAKEELKKILNDPILQVY